MSSMVAGGQSGITTSELASFAHRPKTHPIARIHLLGPMRATSYLGDDILPRAKKVRAMLGYLCFAFGTKVPRARLAAMFWDRAAEDQARASFRHALSELMTAMGPLAAQLIVSGRGTVRLNTDACWIDALALLESSHSDSTRTDLAVLCTGQLLEGLEDASPTFEEWLRRRRITLTEKLRASLDSVLHQIDRPDFDPKQLADIARRLLSFDPTHQRASIALMRAWEKLGEPAQALHEHDRCRHALLTTLGVKPSAESIRAYEEIRAHRRRKHRINEPSVTIPVSCGVHEPAAARSRLRVGVLPFHANSSEKERDLAFSLSHEVATALARFRWFDVITPVSIMSIPVTNFLSRNVPQRQQLDYAVDGVMSRRGKYVKIDVRLLDLSQSTQPVWSDQLQLECGELHRLNELVVGRIAASIDPVILFIEGQPKRKERYGATGILLLAIPLIYSMERGKFQQAGRLIERALQIEPDNSMAVTWSAYWHLWHVGQCWTPNVARTLSKVEELCLKAMELDPDNSDAMGIYAHTLSWKREFDSAIVLFDRALRLNPNLAYIWALSAATYSYIGEPDNALKRVGRYLDLAPRDPYCDFFEVFSALAYTVKRDYEKAVVAARRLIKANPQFINGYKPLIASLGHLGRQEEARPYIEKLLLLESDFTVEKFRLGYPFKFERDLNNYAEGLRLAGVPE